MSDEINKTTEDEQNPAWLGPRLARERASATKAILAELGAPDLAAHRASIDAMRAEHAAATAQLATLGEVTKGLESAKAALSAHAAKSLEGASESVRKAVVDLAGDDPIAQLRVLGTISQVVPAASVGQTRAAPVPPPQPAGPQHADHLNVYEHMQRSNPVAASGYLLQYSKEIFEARSKR